MKKFLEDWAVTFLGAFTSVLTALTVVIIQNIFGINIFTLSVWLLVPVGAVLTGFAAASGYLLGSLYFHHKPTQTMLLNMLVIAAGTQMLIYYMEYYTLVLNDGSKAIDSISFGTYLEVAITKAKYGLTRMPGNGVEVGSFGYFIASIQFLGFTLGGFLVYLHLKTKHMCEKCNKYLKKLATKQISFFSYKNFEIFATAMYAVQFCSEEYLKLLSNSSAVIDNTAHGTVTMTFSLHGCPNCKRQLVAEEVSIADGKNSKDISNLKRKYLVPEKQNLLPEFNQKVA